MINNAVLRLMLEQGGKFERRLADLYFAADSENAKKLELGVVSPNPRNFRKLLKSIIYFIK